MVLGNYTQQPEQDEKQRNYYLFGQNGGLLGPPLTKDNAKENARIMPIITAALGRLHWLNKAGNVSSGALRACFQRVAIGFVLL